MVSVFIGRDLLHIPACTPSPERCPRRTGHWARTEVPNGPNGDRRRRFVVAGLFLARHQASCYDNAERRKRQARRVTHLLGRPWQSMSTQVLPL